MLVLWSSMPPSFMITSLDVEYIVPAGKTVIFFVPNELEFFCVINPTNGNTRMIKTSPRTITYGEPTRDVITAYRNICIPFINNDSLVNMNGGMKIFCSLHCFYEQ